MANLFNLANLSYWIDGSNQRDFLGGREQAQADTTQTRLDNTFAQPRPNPYAQQANPYTPGNPGLSLLRSQQMGAINRNFDATQQNTLRSLAQRGALGTAQETSALRQLALDRGRALSGAEADLTSGNYDRANAFESSRLANQVGFDDRQQLALLSYLTDKRNREQQQADAPMQSFMTLAGLGANLAGRYYGMR